MATENIVKEEGVQRDDAGVVEISAEKDTRRHFERAILLVRQEKYDEAAKEYRKVIEINPENAPAHYSLGVVLEGLGRYEEAEKEWTEALRIDPDFQEARVLISCLPGKTPCNRYEYLEAFGIIGADDEDAY